MTCHHERRRDEHVKRGVPVVVSRVSVEERDVCFFMHGAVACDVFEMHWECELNVC